MSDPQTTKSLIRREALRLFAAHGYSAVSMRELAEAVGVRQGGLYNHFPSKQALLVDLMATHLEAVFAVSTAALDGVERPEDRLTVFARTHVTYHLGSPHDVFLAYMEVRSLEPDQRGQIVTLRNRYEGLLRDILQDGLDKGAFVLGDVAVHTRMLLSMMTGATTWYNPGGRLSLNEVVDCYLTGVLQSVGLKGAAA